jgi:Tfp pilus assembly PilM family ATPase
VSSDTAFTNLKRVIGRPFILKGVSTGIGLDIDGNRLRMAALTAGRSGLQLEAFGEETIPAEAMENGRITQPEILADVLRELWSAQKIRETRIVTAIPNQHVFVRNVTLPIMKKRDVFRAVQYHFLSVLPLPLEETIIQVCGTRPKDAGELEATVVAVRRSQIEELATVITLAGLKPVVIEIRPLAARRALGIDSVSQIVVDICTQATQLSYFDKGHLRFTRTIFPGVQEVKGDVGNFDQSLPGGDGWLYARDLAFEINRSVEFWSRESGRELDPQKLVVIGRECDIDSLTRSWRSQSSIEVERGNPWQTIAAPWQLTSQERLNLERCFTIALGLAARGRRNR